VSPLGRSFERHAPAVLVIGIGALINVDVVVMTNLVALAFMFV
jgi:hypothetical protein